MATGPFGAVVSAISLASSGYSAFFAVGREDHGDPPRLKVSGDFADEIVTSAWDAVGTFEQLMVDADTSIMRGLLGGLDDTRLFGSSQLRLPRPAIADGEPFGHLTVPPGAIAPGVPIEQAPVVVQIVRLYQAGYEYLPNAAQLYGQAADTVAGLRLPADPYYLTAVSHQNFTQARDRVSPALRDLRGALADSGALLVQTAENYRGTDAENAEILRQERLMFPTLPPGAAPAGFPT
jgi:hypothetical protein